MVVTASKHDPARERPAVTLGVKCKVKGYSFNGISKTKSSVPTAAVATPSVIHLTSLTSNLNGVVASWVMSAAIAKGPAVGGYHYIRSSPAAAEPLVSVFNAQSA